MNSVLTDPFDHSRFIGYISAVSPSFVKLNFPTSQLATRFRHAGEELNSGLVGNYVVIEGDDYGFLGRLIEIALSEREKEELNSSSFRNAQFHPTGKIELLLSFSYYERRAKKGLDRYPTIGSKVFACSNELLSEFFSRYGLSDQEDVDTAILFDVGVLTQDRKTKLQISPQALFKRHCAIVGTTGGGKSYTVSHLLEQVIKYKGKSILIDATGEYSGFDSLDSAMNVVFKQNTFVHYSELTVSEYFILFRPSEQVQLPKLIEAIKSLKCVKLLEEKAVLTPSETAVKGWIDAQTGVLKKEGKDFTKLISVTKENPQIENLEGDFNIESLPYQIHKECIYATDNTNPNLFGRFDERAFGNCQSMISRIFGIVKGNIYPKLLGIGRVKNDPEEFTSVLNAFLQDVNKSVLRIDLSRVPFEFNVREIIVNVIGRILLEKARQGTFIQKPLLVFMDEAHQFLNKGIRGEFSFEVNLTAFDQIAKEARKYGLFLTLSTQIPRDIPIGTLSQVGTFIVHRLINTEDKKAVENACSEANRASLSFLPVLGEGEALITGVDFPMPVIVKIHKPRIEPKYNTPVIFQPEQSIGAIPVSSPPAVAILPSSEN